MAEVLTGVNGQILRWARENYNMTPGETAAAIGVDEARYLRWENVPYALKCIRHIMSCKQL